jgi:glycosyltransferase involved in cell wall biosynthesis/VanZ family protein
MQKRKIIFLILIILNCITIFYFSNQVADTSSNTSGRVVNFISQIIPTIKNMPEAEKEVFKSEVMQPVVRKLAHFSIYTLLGFFTMNFTITYTGTIKRKIKYSWIFGILYAITDEIHQLFIQGRSCEFRDVCIDSLGVLTGILIVVILINIWNKLIKKNKANAKIDMSEKVDILMATYNGEKYLKEQIESLLNQTYQNIQIIISDDCSTDGTRNILKEYEKNDKIKVFYQENNLGYVKNFEFLLKQVKSELYMLCDQDDIWKKEKVEKSVEKLKNEDLDLVFGDLEVVDENLNTIYKSYNKYMHMSDKIENYYKDYRLQYLYNCMTGCTMLSKKKFLDIILPLPTNSKYMIHDYWIGLIVSLNGKVGYLKEPYILYRQHGNNQVGTKKASKTCKTLKEVRDFSIDIRIGVFETYVQNEQIFSDKLKKQNKEALEYFNMLKTKENFNFKGWNIFYKLYKTETFVQFMKNFMVLNLPFFVRLIYDKNNM